MACYYKTFEALLINLQMANAVVLAFYITVCYVVFVISKIIISVLLYRRWKRNQMVCKDGFSGMVLILEFNLFKLKKVMCQSDVVVIHRWEDGDVQVSNDAITTIRCILKEDTKIEQQRHHWLWRLWHSLQTDYK